MARRKTLPESVRAKYALAERLGFLRSEMFGERGGPELARQLGLPVRTWYNYESGVTVPAEVILKIIERHTFLFPKSINDKVVSNPIEEGFYVINLITFGDILPGFKKGVLRDIFRPFSI